MMIIILIMRSISELFHYANNYFNTSDNVVDDRL